MPAFPSLVRAVRPVRVQVLAESPQVPAARAELARGVAEARVAPVVAAQAQVVAPVVAARRAGAVSKPASTRRPARLRAWSKFPRAR